MRITFKMLKSEVRNVNRQAGRPIRMAKGHLFIGRQATAKGSPLKYALVEALTNRAADGWTAGDETAFKIIAGGMTIPQMYIYLQGMGDFVDICWVTLD